MQFQSFASGSSGNFSVLEDGGHKIAIDCGVSLKRMQEATGHKLHEFHGALISHGHGDHASGFKEANRTACLYGWASYETENHVGVRLNIVKDGETFNVGPFKIQAFEVPHDEPGTLGFYVQGPIGETLVYITDALHSPKRFYKPTIMAIEANYCPKILKSNRDAGRIDDALYKRIRRTHMSIDTALDILKANDLSECREIHLLHLSAGNSNWQEFKQRVMAATGIPVMIGGCQ